MDNNFEECIQLTVNDKPYHVHKTILTTTLEFFEIAHSNKFADPIDDINLDTTINFNTILNIITCKFYGIVYNSITKFNPDEFIEIIQLLSFFGAKNNLISDLIKKYNETNPIPLEKMYDINFGSHDINNGIKKVIIHKLKDYFKDDTVTKIEIPQNILNHIKVFKIQFDEDDVKDMSKLVSHKMLLLWDQQSFLSRIFNVVRQFVDKDGLLRIRSLHNHNTLGLDDCYKQIRKMLKEIGYQEEIYIDIEPKSKEKSNNEFNISVYTEDCLIVELKDVKKIPILDYFAKHILHEMFLKVNQMVN